MGCATFELNGSVGFICGPGINPKPEPCAFCGEPSTSLCDWPMEKQGRIVLVQHLKPGDWIFLSDKSQSAKEIVEIERDCDLYVLHIAGLTHARFEDGIRRRLGCDTFRIPETGTCDKPCCYRCHRSVDDDVDYCRDHWKDQA